MSENSNVASLALEKVTPQRHALILDLPPELRNKIYETVLNSEEEIDITTDQQPSITKVCRQFRQESLGLYYSRNEFKFRTSSKDENALKPVTNWLQRIGPHNCLYLRKLVVSLGVGNGFLVNHPRRGRGQDAWSALVSDMKKHGCSNVVRIHIGDCGYYRSAFRMRKWCKNANLPFEDTVWKVGAGMVLELEFYVNTMVYFHLGATSKTAYEGLDSSSYEVIRLLRHTVFVLRSILQNPKLSRERQLRAEDILQKYLELRQAFSTEQHEEALGSHKQVTTNPASVTREVHVAAKELLPVLEVFLSCRD